MPATTGIEGSDPTGPLTQRLSAAGFSEQEPATVSGVVVRVFTTSRFRLRWLASRLHLFAFVIDARGSSASPPELAERCRELAMERKRGLPRGLQTGVAAMPFLSVAQATPELAAWAAAPQPVLFASLLYPVVMDTAGHVFRRVTPQRLGRVYESYLADTAAQVLQES
jgi:hypothetical protein